MISEKTLSSAVQTALETVQGHGYTVGDLARQTPPDAYNEIHVSRRLGEVPRRLGADSDITQWRLITRAVARKYGDAQEMRRRADLVLDEATLVVDGTQVYVSRDNSDDPIGDDDDWWSGTSEWLITA